MTQAKPTFEMYFKRYIRQQSTSRIGWADEKKKAVKRGVDVSDFKKELGKHLDKLQAVGLAAKDVIKHNGAKDPSSKKAGQAVKTQEAKVASIIADYKVVCKKGENSPFTPAKDKPVWKDLAAELKRIEDNIENFIRTIPKT